MKAELFAGKYNLIDPLGAGGMCDVYRARQLLFDRLVALKLLKPTLARSDDCRRRFLREARNNAILDHHNIITIYEVNEHEGRPYIAMQFAGGGSLKDLFDGGLRPARGLEIMGCVARALDCAHGHDMLHRDLKPENILMTEEGEVKVGDWGLSKVLDGAQNVTHAGVVLGTPEYMSPEQIMSQPLTGGSDLYSVGVMLYEILTRRLPFANETMTDLLQAHIHFEPTPIHSLVPGLPHELSDLVHELLAKTPGQRPDSAAEVAERLDAARLAAGPELDTLCSGEATSRPARATVNLPDAAGSGRHDTDTDPSIAPPPQNATWAAPAAPAPPVSRSRYRASVVRTASFASPARGTGTTTRSFPTVRTAHHALVFLILTIAIVLAWYRHALMERAKTLLLDRPPTAGDQGSAPPAPLLLHDLTLDAFAGITARVTGHGSGPIRVQVVDLTGCRDEGTLETGTAQGPTIGPRAIPHALRRPILGAARVRLTPPQADGPPREYPVDATTLLRPALDALTPLTAARLAQLLRAVDNLRVDFVKATTGGDARALDRARSSLTVHLDQCGLTAPVLTLIRSWLDNLAPIRPRPGTPAYETLRPLHYLEVLLADVPDLAIPWGSVTSTFGFQVDARFVPAPPPPGWQRFAAASLLALPDPDRGTGRPTIRFIVTENLLERFEDPVVGRLADLTLGTMFHGRPEWAFEIAETVESQVAATLTALGPPPGPGAEAELQLTLANFTRRFVLHVRLNDGPAIPLMNGTPHTPLQAFKDTGGFVCARVRIDPGLLRAGDNKLTVRAGAMPGPGLEPREGVGVKDALITVGPPPPETSP